MKTRRTGHTRTNKFGTTYSVREHDLTRNPSTGEHRLTWKAGEAFINGSVTYQMRCPHCRQPVYFYRNEQGSRVFFNKLGKPWPKHDCLEGVRKMESMPITSATPVTKNSGAANQGKRSGSRDVFINIRRLEAGVDRYNKETRRDLFPSDQPTKKKKKKK